MNKRAYEMLLRGFSTTTNAWLAPVTFGAFSTDQGFQMYMDRFGNCSKFLVTFPQSLTRLYTMTDRGWDFKPSGIY